jgi:hypothetical protein
MKFTVKMPNGKIASRNAEHPMDRAICARCTPATYAYMATKVLPKYVKEYQDKANAGIYGEWFIIEWCKEGRKPTKLKDIPFGEVVIIQI